MTLVKLSGGPRDGEEVTIDQENYLAVLYPGYTPVTTESTPDLGMVMDAEWTGDEVQAAGYEGVLNPTQTESAHAHEDEAVATDQPDAEVDQQQDNPPAEVQEPQAAPESQEAPAEPVQETGTEQVSPAQPVQEPA